MKYFCTYFDSNFIYQGLALYDSLSSHAGDFTLWVLCFDQKAYTILNELNLPHLCILNLKDFETANPALLEIKDKRSFLEYYWTTTPLLTLYILRSRPYIDEIAYLDADLFFYNDLKTIYEEWDRGSLYIIPHHFINSSKQQKNLLNGIYNVGFVGFRNDNTGLSCLERWSRQCLDWCYWRYDNQDQLGDQKYLDDWPIQYPNCIISENCGVGVGGWNILEYKIRKKEKQLFIEKNKLIMLHMNFIEILSKQFFTAYSSWALRPVYIPYSNAINNAIKLVDKVHPDFNPNYHKISIVKWIVKSIRGGIIKIR